MIIIGGNVLQVGVPGDAAFVDGKGLDGSPGTEALRLCGDGRFLVRGVPETDPVVIIRALRDWTGRVLDAANPPTTGATMPDEPILPDEGRVVVASGVAVGTENSLASIVIETDGEIYVNGGFVENDDKLRKNLRRVLERLRVGA